MKFHFNILKRIFTFTLAFCLLTTTVYGKEDSESTSAKKTSDTATSVEENNNSTTSTLTPIGEPVLLFEDAFELAKENSTSLMSSEKSKEFYEDQKGELWDRHGFVPVSNYEYEQWTYSPSVYSYTSLIYNTQLALDTLNLQDDLLHSTIESSLKTMFSKIIDIETSLSIAKIEQSQQETIYTQSQKKYELGLLSKHALEQEKINRKTSRLAVSQLETQLASLYSNLNYILGEPEENRYTLEKIELFEPYTLSISMDAYVNGALKKDISVLMAEEQLDALQFKKNFILGSSTDLQTNQSDFSYTEAKRELKTLKQDKSNNIRQCYDQLQVLEQTYNSVLLTLNAAKTNLHAATIQFEAGNITALELEQAALGITKIEQQLEKLIHTYDLQLFMFKNTSLIQ